MSEPPLDPSPTAAPPRARRLRRALGGSLALAVAAPVALRLAVASAPPPAQPRPAAPLPADVAARFVYPEAGAPVSLHAEFAHEPGGRYSTRWAQFPVTTPGESTPHLVQVIHYRAHVPGRRPAVVISPIMGGSYEVAKLAAATLALHGIHAGIVLRAESYFVADAPEARLERVLRTAVVDRRRAIDWLSALPEVDPARIGALGVSQGGIGTAILAAVEPRVRAAVLVLAGGDLPDVVLRSEEARLRRYVRERGQRGVPPDALRARLAEALVSDPLQLAPYVDPRRLLLFTARFDRSVPADTQERLWRALGGPERHDLPTGHYGAALYLPFILSRTVAHFERLLPEPNRRDP